MRQKKYKKYKGSQKLSDQAKLLDAYLSRYHVCIVGKHNLEQRRKNLMIEFNTPLSSVNYSGMPRGGNKENLGCAALSLRLDDIDDKIRCTIKDAEKLLSDIIGVIETLPANTLERNIIEEKYIDGCTWNQITKIENISRNAAFYNWRKGLKQLTEYKRVQMILEEYYQKDGTL